jgi:uncharacterized membrane protein
MQESQGLAIDKEKLKARLSEADISQVNADIVIAAVREYLVEMHKCRPIGSQCIGVVSSAGKSR